MSFAAVVGACLGLLGPYGSYFNDPALRLTYWISNLLLGTVVAGVLIPLLLRLGANRGLPRLFALAAALIVTAIPVGLVSATIARQFWPAHVADYRAVDWYLQTLLLLTLTTALWALLEVARLSWRRPVANASEAATRAVDGVICLQMEDHYVRIHREAVSNLELMSLHQAIRRYGRGAGLQVHRGWWIADDAVEGAERDARKWQLRLRNGLLVPVARNRIHQVRARGWLIANRP